MPEPVRKSSPPGMAERQSRSQTAVFGKRVADIMRPGVLTAPGDQPVAGAVAEMAVTGRTSIIVIDPAGRASGILTERDVTRRVVPQQAGNAPISMVATYPLHTVSADEYVYRAVGRMRRLNLRHLPVVDPQGRPVGMLDLLDAVAVAAEQMLRQMDGLTADDTLDGMAATKTAQVEIAAELLADNLPAPDIQALITDMNTDIHRRVLDGCVRAMIDAGWGSPPVPFSLLIMGSGGRGENFLHPDQDNGFILADYPDDEHVQIDPYFIALAERFNNDLDRVGFPLCRGHVMARNPVWRKTASQWREQVSIWARRRSPVAILFADIFFDFRAVTEPLKFGLDLRAHVAEVLLRYPALLSMMAKDETNKSVALGLFGNLARDTSGESPGRIDLKMRGSLPLVASARLWALKHGIVECGTLARLAAIAEKGSIDRDEADELAYAFRQISFHLLRQQLEDYRAGRHPGNFVDPDKLLRRERDELRHALKIIEHFRVETRASFTGAVF